MSFDFCEEINVIESDPHSIIYGILIAITDLKKCYITSQCSVHVAIHSMGARTTKPASYYRA